MDIIAILILSKPRKNALHLLRIDPFLVFYFTENISYSEAKDVSKMDKLATYVGAIFGLPSPVSIIEFSTTQDMWLDQGIEVRLEQTIYRFDNGVVIRHEIEQDEFPSELACAECLISYEIIEQVPGKEITPASKRFDNTCQESFWLKYHLT
nr:hypothetical protein [uncultured Pseudogulbenkiania sp.]